MKFIVGLGNPDLEHRSTKHNIGFNIVKEIAKKADIRINQKLYSSILGRGRISGEDVTLILPQTYMNRSGHAVAQLYDKEMKDVGDLVVICDDVNMKLGRIRLKRSGSSGGHKGLESIINLLKRSDFPRLRVGIATEIHRGDITNYVLSPFARKQRKNATHAISLAKDAVIFMLEKGMDKAMARFNSIKAATS